MTSLKEAYEHVCKARDLLQGYKGQHLKRLHRDAEQLAHDLEDEIW